MRLYSASAPGSLMLLGEHAVLHGQPALVCAIDKRIHVTLTPRGDTKLILSSVLGEYETNLSELTLHPPFQFVLGSLKRYQGILKKGCQIQIESEYSSKTGLGSSAAVTVATLAVVRTWLGRSLLPFDLLKEACLVIQEVQGTGSGADAAASVYGGVLSYCMRPLSVQKLPEVYPLTVVYSGSKTPTPVVIQHVQQRFGSYPEVFRYICMSIGACTKQAMALLRKQQVDAVGFMMNIQQGLMEALGVSTPVLEALISQLKTQSGITGAKISGSGLGDCVIGWGSAEHFKHQHQLALQMTARGVEINT